MPPPHASGVSQRIKHWYLFIYRRENSARDLKHEKASVICNASDLTIRGYERWYYHNIDWEINYAARALMRNGKIAHSHPMGGKGERESVCVCYARERERGVMLRRNYYWKLMEWNRGVGGNFIKSNTTSFPNVQHGIHRR